MKKLTAILMTVVFFMCSVVPVSASVENIKESPYKNGVSADIQTSYILLASDEKLVQTFADEPVFTTIDAAADYLREKMIQREASIPFAVEIANAGNVYSKVYREILDKAFLHTGDPKAGDYLHSTYTKNSTSISISGNTLYYTYENVYKTTYSQEKELDAAVEKLIAELNLNSMNDYQKINTVYDYLCKNIAYDYTSEGDLKYTAYAALMNKTAVCQGYATLAYRLLLEVGIDTRMIRGISYSEGHAWNIVKLKGKYYNIDATWDSNTNSRMYFLKCNGDFQNHTRNSEYQSADFNAKYPMADTNYVYNAGEDAPNITVNPTNAPVKTAAPTVMPTAIATPAETAETVDKTKPYIYFEKNTLNLTVGETVELNMYFGGGNEYACNELLLSYQLTNSNCSIKSAPNFGAGVEQFVITASSVGKTVLTRKLLNKNRELLGSATLTINVTNEPIATPTPTQNPTPTPTQKPTPTPTQKPAASEKPYIYFENDKIEIQQGEKANVKVYFGGTAGYSTAYTIFEVDNEEVCGYRMVEENSKEGYAVIEIDAKKVGRNAIITQLLGGSGALATLDAAMLEVVVYAAGNKPVDDGSVQPFVYYEEAEIEMVVGETKEVTLRFGGGDKYEWYDVNAYTSNDYNQQVFTAETVDADLRSGFETLKVTAVEKGVGMRLVRVYCINGLMGYAMLKIKVYPEGTNLDDVLKGDVNGDGKVNSRDIAMIQKHLTGMNVIIDEKVLAAADYNEDSKVNSRDIAAINKKLLGW